ncbi:hypothetical protein ACLB2K_030611 [Fragaria x ananassa]
MAAINTSGQKKNKIHEKFRSSWQTAPDDIMQHILQRLSLWDRIKLRMVCKSWRSVSMRKDHRSSPTEMPWLLLQSSHPNPINNKYISFYSLTDSKVHKLTLPRAFRGGWIHGSTQGWLVLVKGNYSKMILLDPISGAQQKLPSLTTVFPHFACFKELKGSTPSQNFCDRVVLSTSDIYSEDCIIAATFRVHILALCKPGDKRWRKVLQIEQSDWSKFLDILFSCGRLYALVFRIPGGNNEVDIADRTEIFGEHKLEVKVVYDTSPGRPHPIIRRYIRSNMLESISKNEVLLLHHIQDICGEVLTILVYKLDVETGKFHEVKHLGNQIIFLSEWGSSSLIASAASKGNCIYFATFNRNPLKSNFATGIFYPESGRIEPIPCVDRSVLLHLQLWTPRADHTNGGTCWFTPSVH